VFVCAWVHVRVCAQMWVRVRVFVSVRACVCVCDCVCVHEAQAHICVCLYLCLCLCVMIYVRVYMRIQDQKRQHMGYLPERLLAHIMEESSREQHITTFHQDLKFSAQ